MNEHPTLPEFDYVKPPTLSEASDFLAHNLDARPFLGGTDVLVQMRNGTRAVKQLVDVKHLDGMDVLNFDPKSGLTLGAAVNMNRVIASNDVKKHYPLLAEACRTVASYQLRTRATITGNICNASPAGDTIGACLLLNASLQIHGIKGKRQEPLDGFFLEPGKTILNRGDIVTTIHFPPPPRGYAGKYIKLGRNRLSDLSIVGVTAFGYPDASLASGCRLRLALASVAPVPLLITKIESLFAHGPVNAEMFQEAGRLAGETCSPISDVRGGERYRRQMVRNLSIKALTGVWEKINQ